MCLCLVGVLITVHPKSLSICSKFSKSSSVSSAITFNGHRIHYDRKYSIDKEGYPGLVVHGPLMATFLLDLASKVANDKNTLIKTFKFRLMSPVFVGGEIFAQAKYNDTGLDLWIKDQKGNQSLSALAEFSN